ncbi:PorP/SprF family type IX secretion system membrane protein [Rubrolithibacter danxiaensis]|uniref:PorP/SprF family type IX secretion system membrane protein n=1 Tax=Rubrolithibacter danxiaensis TaxID=3390805 RepID=UPI003BF8EB08
MRNLCLTLFFLFITACSCFAQQEAQYSQYMFNSLVINPAYAGYKEALNITLLHRDQWTGVEGAPKTQSLILDGAFFNDNKVGLGLSVINDKVGLQHQTSAFVNYSYRIPMGEDGSRLSFGLAFGVSQYTLNNNDAVIDDPSDPNLLGGRPNYFAPDARFGVFYSNEHFYAGLSATNVLAKEIDYKQVGANTISKQGRHYFLTAGYLYEISDFVKLKPSFLLKQDTKSPMNLDINSFVLLNETIWVGASYRTSVNMWKKSDLNVAYFNQNSVVGAVEVFIRNNFRVGYAYDYSLSTLSSYSNGSHEISVGLILNNNKKSTALLTPRYF